MQSAEQRQSTCVGIEHVTGQPHTYDDTHVAIVGMACRFPGTANSVQAYWKALLDGANAAISVPSDRWSLQRFFHPQAGIPGRSYVDRGSFLSQPIDEFDAGFFHLSPREAMLLDPQQRLMLEVSWEALEDSGLAPTIRGTSTGVYVGGFMLDHFLQLHGLHERAAIAQHTAVAATMAMLSNRLSHAFDLRGPSLSLDTACSSSLVALHLACRALLAKECTVALCGGVNVMSRPELMISDSQAGLLSPDGLCKAFDAAADGYGRGEGAGVIVLKRLVDAQRDGDTIRAVIAGTGVNQDGCTDAITSPSPAAQCALMEQVQRDAGIRPDQIQYVEAHGTGTQAGDRAETYSIGTAIATRRLGNEPLWIGSAKTAIGHLEAAAGVASVIKAVLALEHRTIPPHLNFRTPNPAIEFESLRLRIPLQPEPWPATDGPAGVAVNAFGYGGTNAHAILLEAPPRICTAYDKRIRPAVFPVSASSPRALVARTRQFAQWLRSTPTIGLSDLGYTQTHYRPHHAYRTAFVASDTNQLLEQLDRCVDEQPSGRTCEPDDECSPRQRRVAFVYTGMGIQFRGMGAALLVREPLARALLEQCEALWRQIGGAPFAALLTESTGGPITAPEQAQVTNFVLQIILTKVAASYGLRPACYVGHSVGEIAAAYASEALSLESAMHILYHRSRLMARTAGRGAMLAVALSPIEIAPYLTRTADRIDIAALNGPHSVTLAGDEDTIDRVSEEMTAAGVFNRRLNTDVAYHSHHLDSLEGEFKAALASHAPQQNTSCLYSTVTAAQIDSEAQDVHYWWRNAREPVRWGDALAAMLSDGVDTFVEIGPYPILARSISDGARQANKPAKSFALQKRGEGSLDALLEGIAQLYCSGAEVDWHKHYPDGQRVALPAYPWDRERLWSETALSRADRLGTQGHPLLSTRIGEPQASWDADLAAHLYPYLPDHGVAGEAVLPAAVAIEMALAAHPNRERPTPTIDCLLLHNALAIDDSPLIRLQVDNDGTGFAIYSRTRAPDAPWNRYASGSFGSVARRRPAESFDHAAWSDAQADKIDIDVDDFYARVTSLGFDFGAAFRCLRQITIGQDESVGTIQLAPAQSTEANQYFLHPCLLDAALQTLLALVLEQPAFASKLCLPVSIQQIQFFKKAGSTATCRASITEQRHVGATGSVTLYSPDGKICASLTGIAIRTLDAADDTSPVESNSWTYETTWEPEPVAAHANENEYMGATAANSGQTWLVYCDTLGVAEALIARARAQGTTCISIHADTQFRQDDGASFALTRGSREDIKQMLVSIDSKRIDRIVYLWGLRHELQVAADSQCDLHQVTGLADVLDLVHLVQELERGGRHEPIALAVISHGAQAIGANKCHGGPGQQTLIGLMRVIRAECPSWDIKSIDVDFLDAGKVADTVLTEWTTSEESEVAFRNGDRYVPRIVRASLVRGTHTAQPFRASLSDGDTGAYLVTGGSSGLGLVTATWLAERGARHIAILSRRGPTDALAHETLAKLQAHGVAIWIVKCDLADAAQLQGVLEKLKTVIPPIRGVIHAAATLEDASLITVEDAAIERVFQAKAFGAWNLHNAFNDSELDFFVTYSSISALVGNEGQAAYAAANGFLEGLVHWRRAQGDSGTNVHWGVIGDVGMVARSAELRTALASRGLQSIAAKSGLMVLEQAMDDNRASLGIFDIDWPRWQTMHSTARHDRRLTHLLNTTADESGDRAEDNAPLVQHLQSVPAEERWQLVYSVVVNTICKVLQIADTTRVRGNSRLNDLGVDSLMAAELARTLKKRTGIPVSPLALLRGLSVTELSGYILKQA